LIVPYCIKRTRRDTGRPLYRQGYHYVVDDQLASGELSWFVTPRASDAKVFEDVAAAWAFIKRLRISGPLEIVDLAGELLAREAG
jgi:hypothetical protein